VIHRVALSIETPAFHWLADFGVGIPSNVRGFFGKPTIVAENAMRWAFQANTTTKPGGVGRGSGLDVLKRFVQLNRGRLDVFSHDGRAIINHEGEVYLTRRTGFEGTLANLKFVCDDTLYCLASEVGDPQPLF
jgi:hypothetical protein